MARLTARDEFGNASIIGANSENWLPYLELDELAKFTGAINKLADLEDEEEQEERLQRLCRPPR